jgi:hypothetical protein
MRKILAYDVVSAWKRFHFPKGALILIVCSIDNQDQYAFDYASGYMIFKCPFFGA